MKRIADRPVYNPLDAGGYYDAPGRYTKAITGAVEDPALDMAIACVAWYPGDDEAPHELLEAALKAAPTGQKPILVFSFSAGPIPAPTLLRLREAGLYPLRGCRNTLRALQRLGWWLEKRSSRSRALPALAATDPAGNSAAVSIDPAVARRMLVKAGLKIPAWQHVASAGEAVAAAAAIGRPVVLKLEHADLLHKTEIGAVVLGLADDASIEREFRRLRDEVAPKSGLPDSRVTIQKQVASGLEMLVAIRRDRVFGTYLAIGFGGTMAELLDDVAIRPLPLAKSDVEAMLCELRGYRLLSGYRGAAGYDVPALVDAALRLGALAGEWGSRLDTLEINPLILHRESGGAWVADVVMMGAPGEKKS
jgi:acyl-CoA synthetase (NDP forming)